MKNTLRLAALSGALLSPGWALAQSFNIDIGGTHVASAAYAGPLGPAGHWNNLIAGDLGPRAIPRDLNGMPMNGVTCDLQGPGALAFGISPNNGNDEQRLMHDFWRPDTWGNIILAGLDPTKTYRIAVISWAADQPAEETNVAISPGLPNNQVWKLVGGPWPGGAHEVGTTYQATTLVPTAGWVFINIQRPDGAPIGSTLLTVNGIQVREVSFSLGTSYCPGATNSTGHSGDLTAWGSPLSADNDVTLRATDLPMSSFGFFITSQTRGFTANPAGSAGNLCLGGSIGRYVGPGQIQDSGSTGTIELPIDLREVPSPTGFVPVVPGDVWDYQLWFRDTLGGLPTSNFTDAVEIPFD